MFRAKKSEPIEIHYKSYQTYQTGPTQLYINEKGRVSTLIHWRGIQIQDTTTRSLANKLCSRNKCVSAWMFRKSLLQSNSADHSQIVSAAARVKMFQITVRRLLYSFPRSCICIWVKNFKITVRRLFSSVLYLYHMQLCGGIDNHCTALIAGPFAWLVLTGTYSSSRECPEKFLFRGLPIHRWGKFVHHPHLPRDDNLLKKEARQNLNWEQHSLNYFQSAWGQEVYS